MYYDRTSELVQAFLFAPLNYPDLLPSVLPLIGGAVVIELYFGKHKHESLGWNTAVGNAVIWITTAANLYMTEPLTRNELYATGALAATGLFVAYMDFFHKWKSTLAFTVSSSGVIYTLAYILVVYVKTGLTYSQEMLRAAALFFIGVNVAFTVLQGLETDMDSRGLRGKAY